MKNVTYGGEKVKVKNQIKKKKKKLCFREMNFTSTYCIQLESIPVSIIFSFSFAIFLSIVIGFSPLNGISPTLFPLSSLRE